MKRLIAFLLILFTVVLAGAQDPSKNYILSKRMLNSGGTSYVDGITYYDGIGRPVQTLTKAVEGGSVKKRMASLTEYDGTGRPVNQWLPVSVTADYTAAATLKSTATGASGYGDSRPYAQTIYEQSPLDRTIGSYGPGAAWSEHGVTTAYLSNTASGVQSCKLYAATSTVLTGGSSNYAAGTLQVVKTTDEDGHVSYAFTDRLGRTLLTRQMNGDTQHDTYYVYDPAGNLRYVLQPEYQTTPDTTRYAFRYTYDKHNLCVRKSLPGADCIIYEYNPKDQLTFSQDGNQRGRGKWTYYEYDNHGRLTEQGECVKSGATATGKTAWVKNYYDEYDFLSEPGFADGDYVVTGQDNGKGHLTGRALRTTDGGTIAELICYDEKGRESWVMRNNLLGEREIYISSYTYSGKPYLLVTILMGEQLDSTSLIVGHSYTYDHSDRLSKVEHYLNTGWTTLSEYTYDDYGRLASKKLHGSAANQLTYSYNIRDWLTGITGTRFTQNLYYNTGNGTPCYNGNISSMTWRSGNEATTRGYKFAYDGLDRLTTATYGEGTSISGNANWFTEKVTSYDKNGNIKVLQRYGQTSASFYGLIDNLTYTLDGNQLSRVDDAAGTAEYNGGFEFRDAVQQADEYDYDYNGNLTKDLNRGIDTITYNFLNLPSKVEFTDGSTIEYVYAADGTKLRTKHTMGGTTTTTDYCGNVIYENGTRKYLLTEEGYVTLADNKYHYYLKDHQGNNRVVIASDGTVEETNHYYPFGGLFASTASAQPYKYNGKEFDSKNGLNWYDYGARIYDPALGRFTTVDPMAEDYYSWSPYVYCYDSPVKFVDPDGQDGIISIYGNNITISSNIILTGPHATSQLAKIYKAGIMDTWGKQTSYMFEGKSYNISWNINVRTANQGEKRTFDGLNNYMEVRATNDVSKVGNSNWGYIRGNGRNGMSLAEDNPMPHEFGHMLGLKDHYRNIEGNGNKPYIDEGWEGNIMAAPAGKGQVDLRNLDILLPQFIIQSDNFLEMNKDVPWRKYMKASFYINKNSKEK